MITENSKDMNLFYKSLINQVENKMAGYLTLLNYRYQNLCVKADPISLMPVNVMMAGEAKNIEDVAKVGLTDEYHLAVFPNQDDLQPFIIEGIAHSHPEFMLQVQTYNLHDKERHYLLYEMPKVDKNRYHVLTQGVNSLHDECKVRLDEIHTENLKSISELLKSNPADLDAVKKELNRIHDDYIGKVKNLKEEKLAEIEEAYQRDSPYARFESPESDLEPDPGYNVATSMVMVE